MVDADPTRLSLKVVPISDWIAPAIVPPPKPVNRCVSRLTETPLVVSLAKLTVSFPPPEEPTTEVTPPPSRIRLEPVAALIVVRPTPPIRVLPVPVPLWMRIFAPPPPAIRLLFPVPDTMVTAPEPAWMVSLDVSPVIESLPAALPITL